MDDNNNFIKHNKNKKGVYELNLNFYHDTKIKYCQENLKYYNSGFNYNVWKRYLKTFDTLSVHTRLESISKSTDISESESSGPNVTFEPIKTYKGLKSIFNIKKIILEIEESINDQEYFIIRIPSIIGLIAGLLLIRKKKKYMVEVVGCARNAYLYRGDIVSKLIALPMYYLQKKVVRNASVASYITENYLSEIYKNNKIIYTGVSNVHYDSDKDVYNGIRKMELALNDNNDRGYYTVGLIGSLDVNYKGHLTAFKAVKFIKESGYNIHLKLVGPGNLKRWKRKINKLGIEDNIELVGKLPAGEAIDKYLKELDFYIQPSKTEGHGRALVEAVNNSCVCFGSNVGGIPETLNKDYLFKPGDYKGLSRMIIEHMNSQEKKIENIEKNYSKLVKYNPILIEKKREAALECYRKEGLK